MASKKNKPGRAYANTLKGKDLVEFKKKFYGKEPLFLESVKRARELISRTKFLED